MAGVWRPYIGRALARDFPFKSRTPRPALPGAGRSSDAVWYLNAFLEDVQIIWRTSWHSCYYTLCCSHTKLIIGVFLIGGFNISQRQKIPHVSCMFVYCCFEALWWIRNRFKWLGLSLSLSRSSSSVTGRGLKMMDYRLFPRAVSAAGAGDTAWGVWLLASISECNNELLHYGAFCRSHDRFIA